MRSRFAVFLFGYVSLLGAAACSGAFSAGGSSQDDGEGGSGPGIGAVSPDGGDATAPEGGGAHAEASAGADGTTLHDTGAAEAAAAETGVTGAEAGADEPASCASGTIDCGGSCVPSDVHNCGSCGHDCTNLAHVTGTATCTAAGACSFPASACATGWDDCDGNPDDGCETDITLPATCGSCTNACGSTAPVCAGGQCSTGCPSGNDQICSGSCVDTTGSATNCSSCGHSCPNGPANSQPTCSNSTCGFACTGVYTGCPTASPTACYDESSDPAHCGSCTNQCAGPTNGATGTAACSGGGCTLNCNPGLTACPATGIPTTCDNLTNDLGNCGSCGNACPSAPSNATEACANKQCGFTCNTGFVECPNSTCSPAADTVNGAFVSSTGAGSTCTATAPCGTIAAALATGKSTIYVDQGTYTITQRLTLGASITINGGWTNAGGGSWNSCVQGTTTIEQANDDRIFDAQGSGTWNLNWVTLENNTTAAQAESLYGVSVGGGALNLKDVNIVVAAGGAGPSVSGQAATGAAGATPGVCTTAGDSSTGSVGGPGPGGTGGAYVATGFSPGGGTVGGAGGSGNDGNAPASMDGTCGGAVTIGCEATCGDPPSCVIGTCQCNGGSFQSCGGNGHFGCGGGGGGGGSPGGGGGASIGVFLGGGTVTFDTVSISTGNGGAGGDGQAGGAGGTQTLGVNGGAAPATITGSCSGVTGSGSNLKCANCASSTGTSGGKGGDGGQGGAGGAGGGGSGGDSLCYAVAGGTVASGAPTCAPGQGGPGGNQGESNQGSTGKSAAHN